MTHERYRELLALAIYDELDATEREDLDRHLESCASCTRFEAELTDGLGALARGVRIDEDLPENWSDRIASAIQSERPRRLPTWVTPAASFAAGLLTAWMIGSGSDVPPTTQPAEAAAEIDAGFDRATPPPPAESQGPLSRLRLYLRRK